MNELETLKWGAILSGIGIAFGWFLNQLTGWWRVRRDDKRVLKQVLYNLLEVHHLLNRFDIDEPVEKISERLLDKLSPEENTEENRAILKKFIYKEAASFFQSITSKDLKVFEEKYENSITELSKIEPIRAFYLSDKTKIIDKIKLIEAWVDNVYEKYPSDATEMEITKRELSDILSPNVMDGSLKDLKQEMIAIAWKINPIIWLRTKNLLNKNNQVNAEWENKINDIVIKIMGQIQQHLM